MNLINLIETDETKNCPKPECGKPEYLTRRSAGRTLSICPNGHSWDRIELAAQRQKHERATKEEGIFSSEYDFLRQQTIIKEPARPRNDGVFRSPYTEFVDPLKQRRERDEAYEAYRQRLTKTPSIRMSRETFLRMPVVYPPPPPTANPQMFGLPIVFDETIEPGLIAWTVECNPRSPYEWEKFERYIIQKMAVGLSLDPADLES